MSVSVHIDDSDVLQLLNRIERFRADGRPLAAKLAQRVTQDHFRDLSQERHRGGSDDYYGRAAGSTTGRVRGDDISVSIAHEGIGLRRFGGTVTPKRSKYLAIPDDDNATAQRRSPRDVNGLHFRPNRNGGGRLCDATGRVYYWLVKKTTHRADPSVLPTDKDFTDGILPELQDKLERIHG